MPPLSFYVGRFGKLLEDGSSNRKAKNILKDRSGPHVSFALCPLHLLLVCSECRFFFRSWSKNKQTHKQKQTQRRWTRKTGRSLRCWELLLGSCTSLGLPIAFTWHEKEKKKRLSLCDLGFHVHLAICNCNIKLLALRLLEIQGGSQVLIHHGFISWHSKGPRQKKKRGTPKLCPKWNLYLHSPVPPYLDNSLHAHYGSWNLLEMEGAKGGWLNTQRTFVRINFSET